METLSAYVLRRLNTAAHTEPRVYTAAPPQRYEATYALSRYVLSRLYAEPLTSPSRLCTELAYVLSRLCTERAYVLSRLC
jgi:hypothetical protein